LIGAVYFWLKPQCLEGFFNGKVKKMLYALKMGAPHPNDKFDTGTCYKKTEPEVVHLFSSMVSPTSHHSTPHTQQLHTESHSGKQKTSQWQRRSLNYLHRAGLFISSGQTTHHRLFHWIRWRLFSLRLNTLVTILDIPRKSG
jgi:hypothetical protein